LHHLKTNSQVPTKTENQHWKGNKKKKGKVLLQLFDYHFGREDETDLFRSSHRDILNK